MPALKEFNKDNLKSIRADIDAALKSVETKYGMKFDLGRIGYAGNTFSGKLSGALGEAAEAADNGELKWRTAYLRTFFVNFDKEDLGKEVSMRGNKYVLVGARPKADNPLVLRRVGSDKYIAASEREVAVAMGKK